MTDTSTSKREHTRQAILDAAYTLFLEQGFHGTSMRQIATRAGLALGSIYNHFPGKEAIFSVLILEYHPIRAILPMLESVPGDTVESFARNAALAIVSTLGSQPEFLKLFLIEIIEFNAVHAPALFQSIRPGLAALLQRFASSSHTLREIPPTIILRSFLGLFFSFFITEYLVRSTDLPGSSDAALDQFVEVFLHGILKSPETA